MAEEYQGNYVHTTWIHAEKGHTFSDNDPNELLQAVLDDPHKWLTTGTSDSIECNTNAIRWLTQFVRNSRPELVIWDLRTRAKRNAEGFWHDGGRGQQHYWIDIGDYTAETLGVDTIIVSLVKDQNMIKVEKAGKYLRLLVDAEMLDLAETSEAVDRRTDSRQWWCVLLAPFKWKRSSSVATHGIYLTQASL